MPVVILIDQASFGGEGDYASLEANLVRYGILTFVIKYGEDLGQVLNRPKSPTMNVCFIADNIG